MRLPAVGVKARLDARIFQAAGERWGGALSSPPRNAGTSMSAAYDQLDDKLIAFIRRQKLFFVATAPLSAEGCVNLSPKGYDSLAIIDNQTVAYVDLGGSGIETHAHLAENGRITLMFCAFEGPANILRLYGHGETVAFDDPRFPGQIALFPAFERARAGITVRSLRVADSCGRGVPA